MKKILSLILCLVMTSSYLQSHEKNYMSNALAKIVKEIDEEDDIYKTALCYEDLDKWFKLLAKLEIPAQEKQEILLSAHQQISHLSDEFLAFLDHLYNEGNTPIAVEYRGKLTTGFVNLDKERFDQEKESYGEYSVFKPFTLNKETIEKLKVKTTYNFVVTTQGEVILGDLQEYDNLMVDDKKILLAPNHAILANGEPVMTAGEITLIGDHDFKLWMIGMTSGHYHPDAGSKEHIINCLMKLGIAKEQIIVFGFQIHKLPWKLLEDDKGSK